MGSRKSVSTTAALLTMISKNKKMAVRIFKKVPDEKHIF
jgi:hypothetical protein